MTDFDADGDLESTGDLVVLADPLSSHSQLPSLAETEARFDRVVGAERRKDETTVPRRRAPRVLTLVGAAAVVLVVVLALIRPDGGIRPAAALTSAIEQTEALPSGSFTVTRVMTAEGRTLSQTGRISFDGDNYTIRYDNVGGIIDPTGGVTPPSIEFREVDGVPYVGSGRGWVESIDSPTTHPMRSLSKRVAAAATADDLDACQSRTAGVRSYCLTTDDPLVVAALQPGLLYTFETVTAAIQVDIDETTGRLARIVVDATDVVVSQPADAPGPGLSLPVIETLHSESSFDGLDQPVSIEVPDLTLEPPSGTVPWQCDGLQHSEDIVGCLEFWGEPELAAYYSTLDLEPGDPPPPGAYGPADAPYEGLDE